MTQHHEEDTTSSNAQTNICKMAVRVLGIQEKKELAYHTLAPALLALLVCKHRLSNKLSSLDLMSSYVMMGIIKSSKYNEWSPNENEPF